MRKKILMIAVAFLLGFGMAVHADASGNIFIKNHWKGTFLNAERRVTCVPVQPDWHSAQWILEQVAGTNRYRIKNRSNGTYLNIEKGLASGPIQPGWHSAQWVLEQVAGTNRYRIKNQWKGTYLNIEKGLTCGQIQPGWHSAQWTIHEKPVAVAKEQPRSAPSNKNKLQDAISTTSPATEYFSNTKGAQFNSDNSGNFVQGYLNSMNNATEQWNAILKMVNAIRQNNERYARVQMYGAISEAKIKRGSGFAENLLGGQVKKQINDASAAERDASAKEFLRRIALEIN